MEYLKDLKYPTEFEYQMREDRFFNLQPKTLNFVRIDWCNIIKFYLFTNNWKTEEALTRATVTVETERIKGPNP